MAWVQVRKDRLPLRQLIIMTGLVLLGVEKYRGRDFDQLLIQSAAESVTTLSIIEQLLPVSLLVTMHAVFQIVSWVFKISELTWRAMLGRALFDCIHDLLRISAILQ